MEYKPTYLLPAGYFWANRDKATKGEHKPIGQGQVAFNLSLKNFTVECKEQLIGKLTRGEQVKIVFFDNPKKKEQPEVKHGDYSIAIEIDGTKPTK